MRVALLFNLKKEKGDSSAEHGGGDADVPLDDSQAEWDTWETICGVRDALAEEHEVFPIEAGPTLVEDLIGVKPDLAFQMAEGSGGASRESHVPAVLEILGIPYTGSDPLTLSLCLDKSLAKQVLLEAGVPTPEFWVVSSPRELPKAPPFPLVVKPLHEGSSMGVFNDALVRTPEELAERVFRVVRRYHQPALVEVFLPGREFTCALLGNGEGLEVLPIVEMNFGGLPPGANPLYSYEAKWLWDRPESPLPIFQCPADISRSLRESIEDVCIRSFTALRCRDWCRVDLRLDAAGNPRILELNPLPGVLPKAEENSCFPKAARAAGLSYGDLIRRVVDLAAERYRLAPLAASQRGNPH